MEASRVYHQGHRINTLDVEPHDPYRNALRVIIDNSIEPAPFGGVFPEKHDVVDITPDMELPRISATYGVERYKTTANGTEVYPLSLIVIAVGEAQNVMFKGKLTREQLERMQAGLEVDRDEDMEPGEKNVPSHNDPHKPETNHIGDKDDNQPSSNSHNSVEIETADYKLVCRMTAATAAHNTSGHDPRAAGFYTVFCKNGVSEQVIKLLDKIEGYPSI